jgi:BBSome-interacting protein 1
MSTQNNKAILDALKEVIPRNGLVFSEKGSLSEILSKPKILPLKSITLQKLEEMEKQLHILNKPEK